MHTRIVVMLALVALSARASAHHSFAAFYLEDQSVSIEGVVTEFHYVNPGKDGRREWSNPARLAQGQIGKDTLKPGDHVIVTGSPSRDALDYKIHLKRIVRPSDGWTWAGRAERR